MEIEKLLDNFVELENDLNIQGVSEKLLVLRKMAVIMLNCNQLQLKDWNHKVSLGNPADISEASKVFSAADRETLKKAAAVNRRIGKRIGEIKDGK